jgi:hypothetical protein
MAFRVLFRLVQLMVSLALATALIVGALSVLASTASAERTPLLQRDPVADVQRAVEAPAGAEGDANTAPTPAVVLVFAGIVLLAALPPVHRVYVYHRPDWF